MISIKLITYYLESSFCNSASSSLSSLSVVGDGVKGQGDSAEAAITEAENALAGSVDFISPAATGYSLSRTLRGRSILPPERVLHDRKKVSTA